MEINFYMDILLNKIIFDLLTSYVPLLLLRDYLRTGEKIEYGIKISFIVSSLLYTYLTYNFIKYSLLFHTDS